MTVETTIVRVRHEDGSVVVARRDGSDVRQIPVPSVAKFLASTAQERDAILAAPSEVLSGFTVLPPIDGRTELWAAGVTYERSREARVEESTVKDVYERVYESERPELFFKAPSWRVVSDGTIGMRADSTWNVPEPELAIVLSSSAEVVGLLVCNDMSSRSIEGDNPLYLPQAKIYKDSAALSSDLVLAGFADAETPREITLRIERDGDLIAADSVSTRHIARSIDSLIEHLFRANDFPDGAVLSTGTGIVPSADLSVQAGDVITMTIEGVGRLRNVVTRVGSTGPS